MVNLRERDTAFLALLVGFAFKRVMDLFFAAFYVAILHVLCIVVALTAHRENSV